MPPIYSIWKWMTGRYCHIIQTLWWLSHLIRIYLNSNCCYSMYSAMYYHYYHHYHHVIEY